jgi:hypothetical protein
MLVTMRFYMSLSSATHVTFHRNTENLPRGQALTEINVPPREMEFIKRNLAAAEVARRLGDTAAVYRSYNALAQYFQVRSSALSSY